VALFHSYNLPWTPVPEEDERLKRNMIVALVAALIMGLVVPFLPVKEVDKTKVEELPPRLAQLVVQQKQKPKPPPPKIEKKKEEKKKEKKKEEKKKEKPKEKKKEKPKEEPKPPPKKSQAELIAEARKKAKSTGLLALSDELSDLRDTTPKLKKSTNLSKGASTAKTFQRKTLTFGTASEGSGGIDTSNLSTGIGSTQLEGRETTAVESSIEQVAKNRVESGSDNKRPGRTYEEVTLVIDSNKGRIFNMYNRMLRKNPSLSGKIVFEITIEPSGAVADVKIVSSELNSPALEKRLITLFKTFDFGAKNVETMVVTFPIDFLPPA
jgi:TonB family protein